VSSRKIPALADSDAERCIEITKKGKRCLLRREHFLFCPVHAVQFSRQCRALTRKGERCAAAADQDSDLCHVHNPDGKYQQQLAQRRAARSVTQSKQEGYLLGQSARMARKAARVVDCPFCGALAGKHCANPTNGVFRNTHDERIAAAGLIRVKGRYFLKDANSSKQQ